MGVGVGESGAGVDVVGDHVGRQRAQSRAVVQRAGQGLVLGMGHGKWHGPHDALSIVLKDIHTDENAPIFIIPHTFQQ